MSLADPRLALYARILERSRAMKALAQEERWDELVDCELDRQKLVGELRTLLERMNGGLSDENNRQAEALIRETLKLDDETRSLAEQGMREIEQRLMSANTSRRLQNTYLAP